MRFGLSPLARGTQPVQWCHANGERFIPAGAGNTSASCSVPEKNSVYPRWRGEHLKIPAICERFSGLSPLARGTRKKLKPVVAAESVYPRWRGEHKTMSTPYCFINGLSPLARGTHASAWCAPGVMRFIPAGAGNTPALPIPVSVATVYPRWRGEHTAANAEI